MRDPRTDPRAGDLLSKPERMNPSRVLLRQVAYVLLPHVGIWSGQEGQVAQEGEVLIGSWRRWAKGAEVIMRGEE